jgi:hypothetical protein
VTLRALRSIAVGVVAVGLAYVAGFVVPTLQNPLALAVVFVLVVTGTMPRPRRIVEWVRLHARLSVVVVAVVATILVLFLVSPTYITPAR